MKTILQVFRQDGHSIRSRNRCFFIARKMFCQIILCNFFQVYQFRRFVRNAFCENRGFLGTLLWNFFWTTWIGPYFWTTLRTTCGPALWDYDLDATWERLWDFLDTLHYFWNTCALLGNYLGTTLRLVGHYLAIVWALLGHYLATHPFVFSPTFSNLEN